jgi:hypothetical protein
MHITSLLKQLTYNKQLYTPASTQQKEKYQLTIPLSFSLTWSIFH